MVEHIYIMLAQYFAGIFDSNKYAICYHSYFTALEKFNGVLVLESHTAGKFWSQNESIYF